MYLARLHGSILNFEMIPKTGSTTPVDLRTRRQIASASNSGSSMAFGDDGSGGGNIAPSLEPATAPVVVEFGEEGLGTEEDIVVRGGGADGGAFGEAVAAVPEGLRTIRALGGIVGQ